MHIAPCTKYSSSTSTFFRISAISSMDTSRASTTREAPISFHIFTVRQLAALAWVDTWIGRRGAASRASWNTPRSEMSAASAPMSCKNFRYVSSPSRSPFRGMILTVT